MNCRTIAAEGVLNLHFRYRVCSVKFQFEENRKGMKVGGRERVEEGKK